MSEKNLLEMLDAWEAKVDPSDPDPNHPYPGSPTALAPDAVIGGGASGAAPSCAAEQERDDEILLDALGAIDPASLDYEEWLKVGMGLHYEGVPCDAWDSWSRRDPDRYKPGECERKWRGFGKGAGQPVKGGTIVELAKQQGWTRPARTSHEPSPSRIPAPSENARETAMQGPERPWIEGLPASEDELGPEDPPLLLGIFDKGSKVSLTAPSKAGKTWAMIRLGLAVATGEKWFGEFETDRGRVLYINCELKPRKFYERVIKICNADGIDYLEVVKGGRFKVMHLRGRGVHNMSALQARIDAQGGKDAFDLIIIDPFYKVFEGKEIDSKDVSEFAIALDRMCTGPTVTYVHHHPKGDMSERNSIDRGSGSGVFGRDVDASIDLLELKRPDDAEEGLFAFKLSFVLRDHAPRPPAILGVRYSLERGCEQWIDHAGQFDSWGRSGQGKGGDTTGAGKHEQAVAKRQKAASVLLWHLLENGIPTDEAGEPVGFTTKQAMEIVDAYLGEGYIGKKDQAFREFFINNSREIVGVEFVQDKGSKMWHLVPQKPPRAPEDEAGEHGAGEQLTLGDA